MPVCTISGATSCAWSPSGSSAHSFPLRMSGQSSAPARCFNCSRHPARRASPARCAWIAFCGRSASDATAPKARLVFARAIQGAILSTPVRSSSDCGRCGDMRPAVEPRSSATSMARPHSLDGTYCLHFGVIAHAHRCAHAHRWHGTGQRRRKAKTWFGRGVRRDPV